MRQRAQVIEKRQDKVVVRVENPSSACGNCSGCVKLSSQDSQPKEHSFLVASSIPVEVGDAVILENSTSNLLGVIGLLYGIPLVGLILGYLAGFLFIGDDGLAGLSSVIGLVAAVPIARSYARRVDPLGDIRIVSRACQ